MMMEQSKRTMNAADLERIHDAHIAAMFSHGMALLRNEASVRDLLQDVFVKLAESRTTINQSATERGYLLKMVHNAAIDRMRREKIRHDHSPTPSRDLFARCPDPDREAFRGQLELSLDQLPHDQREAVVLKLWEGCTFEEISGICGVPLNTAASRYRYGIEKLRQLLRPVYDEL